MPVCKIPIGLGEKCGEGFKRTSKRSLKKKIDREGTLRVVRTHRHFEKPSERRRRKADSPQRKAEGVIQKGCVLALIGEAPGAVQMITSGATAWQATGARVWVPLYLSYLAMAYAEVGQINDARRCIGEAMTAMEATKERWYEAEVYRMAGEIALKSPESVTKAEAYFQHALAIARAQQAKSWELRAALSMARLRRDQF